MNRKRFVPEENQNEAEGHLTPNGKIQGKRPSGLIVRRVEATAAKSLLSELDEFDETEQRETFELLKRALNETRASQGARLIFPDEQTDLT